MYSFFDAFTLHALIYSCLGAVLGIIWGAMPGLSMTMGMALLAQFSYSMNVYDATAFLMGVYTGATFGFNYRPLDNVVFRPELRWDWTEGSPIGPFPFNNNANSYQFSGGFDMIVTF